MSMRVLTLPGPIMLVPGSSLERQMNGLLQDHPSLPPTLPHLVSELNRQTTAGGVPVTLAPPSGRSRDWSLLLHTSTCVTRLYRTKKYGDAYTIASVNPLRIHDHHRLSGGYLVVRVPSWQFAAGTQNLRPGATQAYWQELTTAWHALTSERATPDTPLLTPSQFSYLETLDRLIDANEQISIEALANAKPFSYRSVGATGERRYGTHSVYEFRIAGGRLPDEGAFVQVNGEPERRGQVTRIAGDVVTVRFDKAVDFAALSPQGQLQITPSTIVYKKQREAVGLLRDRLARNPHLLSVLVDHCVRDQRPVPHRPAEPLDPDQEAAFIKSLGTDDLLLVIGPPGTGKTRTISEITRAAATTMGRVLVTSHTNRAVDNVLARLPRGLLPIRVGNESGVTVEGRPYLLERQASDLRTEILNVTERSVAAYGDVDIAARWTDELGRRAGGLRTAAGTEADARAGLDRTRRAAGGPAQARVDELTVAYDRAAAQVTRHLERADRLGRRRDRARARARWPLIGALFAMLARRTEDRLAAEQERGGHLRAEAEQAAANRTEAERHLDEVTRADPAVRAARAGLDEAAAAHLHHRTATLEAAQAARSSVARLETSPPLPGDPNTDGIEEAITALHTWLTARLPLLRARAGLLGEWREEVSGATDQLYPELIRYANVVAATCIGAASRPELADVEFDLAIVDEAGQIGVPDVLVPLVRARRGVLVGDHMQLPPFLASEVDAWGKSVGDQLIRVLLAKSALEQLVGVVPDSHQVMLTQQRRMPAAIADFISAQFYDRRLRTAVDREHRDPVFRSPIAFVDTARLPEAQRTERDGRAREEWGQPGFTNPAEAELLTRLAAFYHRRGIEWAIIVPYKAQLGEIKDRLTKAIGNAELVTHNVGTVDAFQGGERDVIMYGFTRSNQQGNVGFLSELRRANVAFTRAKHQLVMVGDLRMLTHARHARFRGLAQALRDHVADHGDLRPYAEITAQLDAAREEDA